MIMDKLLFRFLFEEMYYWLQDNEMQPAFIFHTHKVRQLHLPKNIIDLYNSTRRNVLPIDLKEHLFDIKFLVDCFQIRFKGKEGLVYSNPYSNVEGIMSLKNTDIFLSTEIMLDISFERESRIPKEIEAAVNELLDEFKKKC